METDPEKQKRYSKRNIDAQAMLDWGKDQFNKPILTSQRFQPLSKKYSDKPGFSPIIQSSTSGNASQKIKALF
ncbi:MAG: hypothetical protein IPN72_10340 [Saprospiraceae bacterium]|nr:hypothetical protein [Saprospiraceae bacterium]